MQPKTTPPAAVSTDVVFAHMIGYESIYYLSGLARLPEDYVLPSWVRPQSSYKDVLKLDNKDKPVFAITNDKNQSSSGELLEASDGFRRLLTFKGSYGNPLSLWVKPRVGDKKSVYGPMVKPIKNKSGIIPATLNTTGFAGCCGALIHIAGTEGAGFRTRREQDDRVLPGCVSNALSHDYNHFVLCVQDDLKSLDRFKDSGCIPIYRFSTPEGVSMLMLFQSVQDEAGAETATLYGRTQKTILSIIKKLQGIKS